MRRTCLFLTFVLMFFSSVAFSQEKEDKMLSVVDDIQIDVKEVKLSPKGDTAIVELFLISYKKNPREFKMNTFASGVVSSEGRPYLYASIQMGRILVHLESKQNYIHYLLEQDVPVSLKIKTAGWNKIWGKPKQVKLVFEDSTEEGKFLEWTLDL